MSRHHSLRVLLAPLDWGLGHATRCIPIIRALRERNINVLIASSGGALSLLRKEFPELAFYEIASYRVRYPSNLSLMAAVFLQLPKFLLAIYREHRQITKIVGANAVDVIISDNRYGAWSKKARSIFITHQINILMPPFLKWIEGVINYFNHRQIKKFDACLIPDWPDSRLTGKLTQPTTLPVRFIGPLSRMSHDQKQVAPDYDVIALLSGPEPQRSVFEKILVDQLNRGGFRYKLVRGLPQQPEQNELPNSFNHLPGESLAELLNRAKVVVARSGYSTVMDLAALGTKAIFVPTPGQTEQEYLAQKLMAANMAYSEAQADFDLKRALERGAHYPGFESSRPDSNLLADALDSTIEKNEL